MSFEKFQKTSGRGAGREPMISLRQSESIGINSKAVPEYFEDSTGAILYYNEDDNQIGIQPADKDDPDAYSLQYGSEGRSASINASSFLKQYDLVPEQTTRYDAHWNEEQQLIYINVE